MTNAHALAAQTLFRAVYARQQYVTAGIATHTVDHQLTNAVLNAEKAFRLTGGTDGQVHEIMRDAEASALHDTFIS